MSEGKMFVDIIAKTKIKWWEKALLFFIKPRMAVDLGVEGKDKSVKVFYKCMNGKIYIIDSETKD